MINKFLTVIVFASSAVAVTNHQGLPFYLISVH